MKKFKVGVFPIPSKKKPRYTAYTTWYDTSWDGCCEHEIEAENGAEAKKKAIAEHKNHCVNCT